MASPTSTTTTARSSLLIAEAVVASIALTLVPGGGMVRSASKRLTMRINAQASASRVTIWRAVPRYFSAPPRLNWPAMMPSASNTPML